jgi:hypothetical protein
VLEATIEKLYYFENMEVCSFVFKVVSLEKVECKEL